jgi:plasmid stabilization system protein ParE
MSRRLFVVTPEARADLIEIWNYIAEDSVDGADKVLARIYDAFARLGQTPGMGHHREDLADPRTASGRFTPTSSRIAGKRRRYRSSPSSTARGSWRLSFSSGFSDEQGGPRRHVAPRGVRRGQEARPDI